jgi:hypothetical protein
MSLKAIHIVFITAAMLLSLVFGGWALNGWLNGRETANLIYTIVAATGFLGLACYGWFFLKKLKNISYL